MRWIVLSLIAAALLSGCGGPSATNSREAGITAFQTGNTDKAKDHFNQVLGDQPYDAPSLYYMGRIAHAEGFYPRAIYLYQCSIDADPSQPTVQKWLSRAQEEAGEDMGKTLRFIPEQTQLAQP